MSLLDKLRGALGFGPKLRNKPGGMAWINGLATSCGAEELNNRAVKTVRVDESGLWEIEPTQRFVATHDFRFKESRSFVKRGSVVFIHAIGDEHLEPWRDTGLTTDEVRDLYAPAPEKVLIHSPEKGEHA
jgi:hypothetical protein